MIFSEKAILNNKTEITKGERCIFWLLLLCFTGKTLFFAFNIKERVFPDETSWLGMVQIFSRSFFLPVDSPESYPFGLVSHIPNLYFLLMGKLLTLNIFGLADLIFLRLVNVCLGIITVIFAWRLICLLLPNIGGRLLALVMLTNTMMFTFMFGAVNYDNLSSLLAVLALYTFVVWIHRRQMANFLWFAIFFLAGTITKNVFLPFALGLFIVLLVIEARNIVSLSVLKNIRPQLFNRYDYGKLLVVLILLAANINLYLGNKIRYDRVLPSMDQVLSVEDCLQSRLYARGYTLMQFKSGKLSMLEAQRLALQIRAPGDRADAMQLLLNASLEKGKGNSARVGRLAYAQKWFSLITARLYGVAAHLALYKTSQMLWGYYGIFLLAVLLLAYRFFQDGFASFGGLLFVVLFYILILMQVVNYGGYNDSGMMGVALTGRYLFPVILPLYILIGHGLMSSMPAWWQWLVGVSVAGFFMFGDLPWFLLNAGGNWYS